MNDEKNLSARIAERMKIQLDCLGMGSLPRGTIPHLISGAEEAAAEAAFAYIDALNQRRVVDAIREVHVPKKSQVTSAESGAKASVLKGVQGAQPLQKGAVT